MSFYDLPTVDDNSKLSEESVLSVRTHFCKRNGFILRVDDPDYGTDVFMELINENSKAKGQRIPAQIKSAGSLAQIDKGNQGYVSINFPTSTLGYLCQHAPVYGIILVYDDSSKKCYFDYVEAIVIRLTEERESEDWKDNKTVAIHIPIANILSNENVQNIHRKFSNRFEALSSLLHKFGEEFDIPILAKEKKENKEEDLTAKDLLLKYGMLLLDETNINRLYQLLDDVPFNEIITSKELILIAAVVYSEIGKCLEGEYYLNKSDQIISQYTQEEIEILKFTRIKVDFFLGKRNKNEFYEDLKSIQAITDVPANAIQVKINLFYYKIGELIGKNEFDDNFEKELLDFFDEIETAEISTKRKHIFKVFHSENLHMFLSSRMLRYVGHLRVRESLGENISQDERWHEMKRTNSCIQILTLKVLEALDFAKEENNDFLKAHSYYVLSRFFFTKEFDFLLLDFHDDNPSLFENYKRTLLFAAQAHNLFLGMGLLKDAYKALQTALELIRLATIWHNIDLSSETITEAIILKNLRAAEIEIGVNTQYASMVDKAFEDKVSRDQNNSEVDYKNLTDENIESFAKTVLKVYQLPDKRLIHIINEMKSYRFFHKYCDTQNFQLLCNLAPHQNQITKYAIPTSYIVVSKKTGIQSRPGTDVEELAKTFGALK